jgi:hypothetical protein
VLSDGSLVSERNPACSNIDVVADGERIQQSQFSSQCAWNGNISRSQTQNAVRSNSPVQKVACLSLPTSASRTKAPNNQQDFISKLHASFLPEERRNHDLQQVNEEEEALLQAYPKTTGTLTGFPPYSGMKYRLSSTKTPELLVSE